MSNFIGFKVQSSKFKVTPFSAFHFSNGVNVETQLLSELMIARRQRNAQRAVLQRTVKRVLQLATQQAQLRIAELSAGLRTSRQFGQKGAE